MNSKIRIGLASAACLLGCGLARAQVPDVSAGNPAPAVESQLPGSPPSQGYVWMSGHWNSEGGQWKWIAAHWDLPPSRSATWVGGHWVSSGGNWVWVNGAWNVSDAQQSQAGPPQPPGAYAQGGVPAPSTPAPYVDGQFQGQYATGGIVRAGDQGPVTTDYGPADYSALAYPAYGYPGYVYPAYGWAGDPWFWGFPSVALGFGFGPRFHGGGGYFRGGGRGFFGHGGIVGRGLGGHFGH
jgi:hypothetical protein